MSRTVTVEVTAEDIANGIQDNCFACPIAIALKRSTGCALVLARRGIVYTRDDGQAAPPREAVTFMDDFDEGRPVAPFTFTVELS